MQVRIESEDFYARIAIFVSMSRQLDKDWVLNQLELLTEYSTELAHVVGDKERLNSFNPMTVLKLGVLAAGVDVYTKIATVDFEHTHYIDGLAGSGLTKISGRDEYVVGSPIVTAAVMHEPFKQMHFIEEDPDHRNSLQNCLDYVVDESDISLSDEMYTIHAGDANEIIPKIINDIQDETPGYFEGANVFGFLDNEGPNIEWKTLNRLSDPYGDLLITFPSTGISRRRGKDKENEIAPFFRGARWKNKMDEDWYRECYMRDLSDIGKGKQEYVRINSRDESGRFYYDMIYATRHTPNGSPWINAIQSVKSRVERLDGGNVEDVLDFFVHGDQSSIDLFDEEDDGEPFQQPRLDRFK